MALVGTQQVVAGVVKSIEMGARPEWSRNGEVPFKVKVVLDLDSGLGAYVDTSVGNFTVRGFVPAGTEPGGYPWAIPGGRDADGTEADPVLTVWAGDRLTLRATVGEVKTSRRGNRYVSANRARIVRWARPEWVGGPEVVRPAPSAPAPAWRTQVAVERPDPGDEDQTCPHGTVVYRAGDCELCDPPVPPMQPGRAVVTPVPPATPVQRFARPQPAPTPPPARPRGPLPATGGAQTPEQAMAALRAAMRGGA